MFNMNPKKIQGMMKKMGMSQTDIPAKKVIIQGEQSDIIIENPSVSKISMQGQETFQISGQITEQESEQSQQEQAKKDIEQVMEKTGVSKEKAEQALKESNGDLAEAILSLS
jgi:nascent polypeptide-associated complex subunit alpha